MVQFTPRIYGSFLGAIGSDSINTTRTVSATETDTLSASPTSQIFDGRYETGINLELDHALSGDRGPAAADRRSTARPGRQAPTALR